PPRSAISRAARAGASDYCQWKLSATELVNLIGLAKPVGRGLQCGVIAECSRSHLMPHGTPPPARQLEHGRVNRSLAASPPYDFSLLAPHLRTLVLERGVMLHDVGGADRACLFSAYGHGVTRRGHAERGNRGPLDERGLSAPALD